MIISANKAVCGLMFVKILKNPFGIFIDLVGKENSIYEIEVGQYNVS